MRDTKLKLISFGIFCVLCAIMVAVFFIKGSGGSDHQLQAIGGKVTKWTLFHNTYEIQNTTPTKAMNKLIDKAKARGSKQFIVEQKSNPLTIWDVADNTWITLSQHGTNVIAVVHSSRVTGHGSKK